LPPEEEMKILLAQPPQPDMPDTSQGPTSAIHTRTIPQISSYPPQLTLEQRGDLEPIGWQPTRVAGTGVDEEEAFYDAALHDIPTALKLLKGSLGVEIVLEGWKLIEQRKLMENSNDTLVS
jgi:hypothetical protein